jgi:hypothetical protein
VENEQNEAKTAKMAVDALVSQEKITNEAKTARLTTRE